MVESVERSAAPAAVGDALHRLSELRPDLPAQLAEDDLLTRTLVAVLGASRSLARHLQRDPDALGTLQTLDERAPKDDYTIEQLVAWKQREFLRIAARDLIGLDALEQTGQALAELGADVLDSACALAGTESLAVIGMGKLGGYELNYSSDIDVMFVGDGPMGELDKQVRQVMDLAKRCFRVDANLRPQGRDGPLVRSLDSYEAYWDRWAEPWEFQALLKAVPVAGEPKLGARFHDAARRWLWNRAFSADDLRQMRHLKQRAEAEVTRKGLADRELKRSPGGIRDIEFTLQLLQLVHGRQDPDLRSPTTLTALAEMGGGGYIDADDGTRLADAYRFLRAVEHRVQLVDEQQTHTIPADDLALDRLARVMGYRDEPEGTAAELVVQDLRQHQLTVRGIHERVYFRPLLEAFAGVEGALDADAAMTRLTAFGFTDAKRTQAAVRELTRGLNRTSRLMQQLLPLLLDWLSDAPDPDLGLLMLRNLLSDRARAGRIAETFRESAEAAQRLCVLLGSSRLLGDVLLQNSDLVSRLPDPALLATRPRDELIERAAKAAIWRSGSGEQQEALKRWKDRNELGIMARDVLGGADVDQVGAELSRLAEAVLQVSLDALDPTVPFAVIAMGRFGGAELSYASDLDVIFVYEGGASAVDEANRLASRLLRFVGGSTPAGQMYEIDADLRPEGKQGPLARSFDGYRRYWDEYALVWERQAMLRARPVAGDLALGQRLLDELAPRVWGAGLTTEDAREIRRIKARVERERMPAGEDPQFHLKLGRGSLSDIEWTAQLLQLRHGITATGTMDALSMLEQAGVLDPQDASILVESYRFCEQTRNRWYLVNSKPGNSLPTQPEQLLWLARSLGMRPGELRERYRKVTRRARRVVERVFYGQE